MEELNFIADPEIQSQCIFVGEQVRGMRIRMKRERKTKWERGNTEGVVYVVTKLKRYDWKQRERQMRKRVLLS